MRIKLLWDAPQRPGEVAEEVRRRANSEVWARFSQNFVPEYAQGADAPDIQVVREVAQAALEHCQRLLPRPGELDIILLPEETQTPPSDFVRGPMGGVLGLTPGAGLSLLRVANVPGWPQALTDALAHEYHHAAWVALRPEIDRAADLPLAEYLAFEGRACAFARLLQPGYQAPWTLPLPELEQREWLEKVAVGLREGVNPLVTGDAPMWAVYRLGTALVDAFLVRHPALSVGEWTRLDGRDVLEGSGLL
ncbi:DUF2268 domain-containing putative Zn-dependent protease [Deinococcus sp.]|uniref:DUF2268 domain-containing putative Zn-dependent protease n=1 Tax=Deinococcus sp. TaxID=47478 RepID=UPI003B5A5291